MTYTPMGTYDKQKAGHPEGYFIERHINMDYRGDLRISPLSYWGFFVTVITASHDFLRNGCFSGPLISKHVYVDDYAWITSNCVLYNCHIQHHAIVSIGSVASNLIVEPYHVVAGNPAAVVAFWDGKRWRRPLDKAAESEYTGGV